MMRSRRTAESIDRAQTTKKSSRGRKPKSQLAEYNEGEEVEYAEKGQKFAMAAATTKSLQDILKASRDARGSQAKVYLNRELLDANFTHLLYANENGRNSTSEAPGLLADWLKRNPIKHGYGPNLS
jgi:predicted Zn-dependent protease